MDRGAWQAAVHGVTESRTQLSADLHTHRSLYRLVCQGWSCNHSSGLSLFSSAPRGAAVALAKNSLEAPGETET